MKKTFTSTPVVSAQATSTLATSSPPILLRLPQVQVMIPVSRSTWYSGVKAGIYPKPYKIGTRASGWMLSDIEALIKRFQH